MVTIQNNKRKVSAIENDRMPRIIRLAGSVCPIIFMVMVSITYLCDYIAFLNGGGYLAQLKFIKENGFSGLEEMGTSGFVSDPSSFAFGASVYLILFFVWAVAMFIAYMMTSERGIIPMLIDVVVMIVAVVSIVSNGIKLLEYSADVDQYYMDILDYNMGIENSGSLIALKVMGLALLLFATIIVFDILILVSSTTRWMMVNKIKAYVFGIIVSWVAWLLMNVVPIIALVIFIVVVIVLLFVEVKFLIAMSENLEREYWMLRRRIADLELNMETFPNSRKYPKWQSEHAWCCERLKELADILHY